MLVGLLLLVAAACTFQFATATTKLDDQTIRVAVDSYFFHFVTCEDHYSNCSESQSLARMKEDGFDDIADWDLSAVTNISRLFSRASLFVSR